MSLLDTASLIVTPNGYKEGKLYSVIPSDGSGDMSVVRATTATRVNSAGLVELVPYNLVNYSEQFDNAAWIKTAINVTSSAIPNPITETLNAQDVIPTATLSAHRILQNTGALNSVNTWSVYAKSKGYNFITILENGNTSSRVSFNLSTGSVATETMAVGQIDSLGNGWYRCSMIHTTLTTPRFDIYVSPTDSINSYTADGISGVTLFGAQAVQGSTALPYQKTETRLNIPRLDYSNGTCPSLLVEPQRTNLALYSEQFDNAAWTKYIGSVTANATTSPSGIQNADKFIDSTDNDVHSLYKGYTISGDTTFSIYVKAAEYSKIAFTNLSDGGTAKFDVSNGTIISTDANWKNSTIENLDNGWYRIASTTNGISGAKALGTSLLNSSNQEVFVGTGTSGIFLWGAQVELGNYSTSYIPTTSASVTRNADVISKTGISSLIGQTEGTFYWDVQKQLGENDVRLNLSDGSTNNWIFVGVEFNNQPRIYCNVGGANQFSIYGAQVSNYFHKIAFAYKANDFVLYIDGVQVISHTSGSVPTCSRLDVGVALPTYGAVATSQNKAAALWKTRLTNDELATLTTI